jgi:hypothetical protein
MRPEDGWPSSDSGAPTRQGVASSRRQYFTSRPTPVAPQPTTLGRHPTRAVGNARDRRRPRLCGHRATSSERTSHSAAVADFVLTSVGGTRRPRHVSVSDRAVTGHRSVVRRYDSRSIVVTHSFILSMRSIAQSNSPSICCPPATVCFRSRVCIVVIFDAAGRDVGGGGNGGGRPGQS